MFKRFNPSVSTTEKYWITRQQNVAFPELNEWAVSTTPGSYETNVY